MPTTDLHHSMVKEVTIIYYGEQSLELFHSVEHFPQLKNGRVVIPESYKQGKSIIAVCEGSVNVLNKFGERIEFQQPLTQVV
jgi:uncharacterized protein (TIGR02922 family)